MNTMAHTLSLFLALSLSRTHTRACLSLHRSTHTQMHSLALSHTHAYTHTHSYTLNTLCRFQSQVLFLLGVLLPIHHSVAAALVLVLITYSVCIREVFFSPLNISYLSFYPSFCWVYCCQSCQSCQSSFCCSCTVTYSCNIQCLCRNVFFHITFSPPLFCLLGVLR